MNAPMLMLPYDIQLSNEYQYSRKHIDKYIRKAIADSQILMRKVQEGVVLLRKWLDQPHYASKAVRLQQLENLDLLELVFEVFVATAYVQVPELFTSVSTKLAGRLQFTDRAEGIATAAEILAVLGELDVYDNYQVRVGTSLMVQSRIQFDEKLMQYIEQSTYLPPMVCPPNKITNNRESGYLTHNDSVILKGYNHHDNDVCLDVINIQNSVPLSLNVDFLRSCPELPGTDLELVEDSQWKSKAEIAKEVREKKANWEAFRDQSARIYALLVGQGNRFWLTHKVDKRGRIYADGYHVTTQGSKYKKAMIELADGEVVTGVPA